MHQPHGPGHRGDAGCGARSRRRPPALLGTLPGDPASQAAYTAFTRPFNITGQPAISLPLSWNSAGLPVGVQLVAAYGREDLLINVAAQAERARPWADRKPLVKAADTSG